MKNTLIRPVITEKSTHDAGKGRFTFLVAMDSTKAKIKKAVEKTFNVKVVSVATSTIKGQTKRTGPRRVEVTQEPWKKATVKLAEGQKIGVFETA